MFEGLLGENPLETIPNIKRLTSTKEPAPVYVTADGWRGRRESRRVPAGSFSTEDIGRDEPVTGPVLKSPQPQLDPKSVKSETPLPPRMPKELTTPYKVKGPESLFLHRFKIVSAAVSGFMSVFVLLFIIKSIFGDALIFGPGATNTEDQEVATLSFGDLLAQTPAVLGVSIQKPFVLSQSSAQGTATLSAGSREIALYSPNLAANSQITVIPENSIEGAIFVARSSADSFTVAVDRPIPSDIPFEWEIR